MIDLTVVGLEKDGNQVKAGLEVPHLVLAQKKACRPDQLGLFAVGQCLGRSFKRTCISGFDFYKDHGLLTAADNIQFPVPASPIQTEHSIALTNQKGPGHFFTTPPTP
jgi:hypothetical protein